MKFLLSSSQLEYDVLEYVVIERLAQGGRDKLKDDGLNLSDWLQSLASFWGHLYVSIVLIFPPPTPSCFKKILQVSFIFYLISFLLGLLGLP